MMSDMGLKEVFEVIWRRKGFIAVFTLLCLLVGLIASTLMVKPVYEMKTSLVVSPVEFKTGINLNTTVVITGETASLDIARHPDNKVLGSVLSDIRYPGFGGKEIIKLISNKEQLEKLLSELGISPEDFSYQDNIKIGYDEKENSINIAVKHGNPDITEMVGKALVKSVPVVIKQEFSRQFKEISDMVAKGIERETKSIAQWKDKLDSFIKAEGGPQGLDRLPAAKQAEYQKLGYSYNLSREALQAHLLIKREVDTKAGMDIIEMLGLSASEEAKLPLTTASPKRSLHVIAAVVLGFMASAVVSVLLEFMGSRKAKNIKV